MGGPGLKLKLDGRRVGGLLPAAVGLGFACWGGIFPARASAAPFDSDSETTVRLAQAGPVAPAAPAAVPPAAAAPADAAPTGMMWGPVKFSAQGEAGIIINPDRPNDDLNFGQLFTDKANQAQLNQILLGAERGTSIRKPPASTGGFKVSFQYGSDSRYTHFLGELDKVTSDRYQFDVAEADLSLHLPLADRKRHRREGWAIPDTDRI